MITIEGTSRKEGVAIAVAAVVDAQSGINSVSPTLLQSGIDALRKGLTPQDYPEAIMACDSLALGAALTIPGITPVGIAAQDVRDVPGLDVRVPCVTGLPDLLKSISDGDIVIVDGGRGVVYIDPDPQTLVRYQEIETGSTRPKVFIASEHIPARTRDGETVSVYAHVSDDSELARALEEGADGLIMDLRRAGVDEGTRYQEVLCMAAGKPVAFVVEFANMELLRATTRFSAAHQVTLLFPPEDYEARTAEASALVETATVEAFLNDLDPPQVGFGTLTRETEYESFGDTSGDNDSLVIDLRKSAYMDARRSDLPDRLPVWIGARSPADVIVLIGRHIDALAQAVMAGARSVAVAADLVSASKLAIRTIGIEEDS